MVQASKSLTVYAERRKKLLSLAGGKQVVATTAQNLFYLSDFYGGGVGIVLPDRTVIVTSPLEQDRAAGVGKEVEIAVVKKWRDLPKAIMKRLGNRGAVVDDDSAFRASKRVKMNRELFLEARRVKDPHEIARIQKASAGLDRIFESFPGLLKEGRTEWQVAAEVMRLATEQGLTPSGSDSSLSPAIIASGENGALPHSELTSRRLRSGDFVVADIFFRYNGYNSDQTRTFAIGTASGEMKKHYAMVLDAQERGMQLAKAGTPCQDVHNEAVKVLRRHGVDKYLNHSIGHGVGIDIHELPWISRGNRKKLVVNDVITIEPGIYLKGRYGIRIEDTVRVDGGPDPLTKSTRDLVMCG